MAMLRYARAIVQHPEITGRGWSRVRTAASSSPLTRSLSEQAQEILGGPLDLNQYLLSHVTIVSSVDTEEVPGARLGLIREGSHQTNRLYSDYRITPETERYINGNHDGFERRVLLKSYPSLRGGQNYLEHQQVLELSKGRILDAVARDLGDTVYVDILVATSRQHKELIDDITSGRLTTLSMGCQIDFSICTQCGNVGTDEPSLCEHVRYGKGGTFLDHRGRNARVAELCGHHSVEDGGVHFIEASWVAIPAFKGAVLRNILSPSELPSQISRKAQKILNEPPAQWVADPAKLSRKAAKQADDNFFGEAPEETPAAPPEKQEKDPVDKLVDDTKQYVLDKADKAIRDKLRGDVDTRPSGSGLASDTNESLVKMSAYQGSMNRLILASYPVAEWIDHLASEEARHGLTVSPVLYRAALLAGTLADGQEDQYLRRCAAALGRIPTQTERNHLSRVGRILWARQEAQQVRRVMASMRQAREE